MSSAVIDLDPKAGVVNVVGQSLSLDALERLWSVVAVFPGLPDEVLKDA